jgi:hypothetical protein
MRSQAAPFEAFDLKMLRDSPAITPVKVEAGSSSAASPFAPSIGEQQTRLACVAAEETDVRDLRAFYTFLTEQITTRADVPEDGSLEARRLTEGQFDRPSRDPPPLDRSCLRGRGHARALGTLLTGA